MLYILYRMRNTTCTVWCWRNTNKKGVFNLNVFIINMCICNGSRSSHDAVHIIRGRGDCANAAGSGSLFLLELLLDIRRKLSTGASDG